jgi:hypothetical protein
LWESASDIDARLSGKTPEELFIYFLRESATLAEAVRN